MNLRTIPFLIVLFFITGIVIGFSIKKQTIVEKPISSITTIRDTIVQVKNDTIKIPVDRVKYYTKTDTVIVKDSQVTIDLLKCVTFPLLLSDSSKISVTECSKENIPTDLTFDARYIEKREKIRIIENTQVDTIKQKAKRVGFSLGPSAGVGIDINDISRPAYFVGVTLTYGLRF